MVPIVPFEEEIKSYQQQQNAAARLAEIVSNMWINEGVELVLFRNQILHQRPGSILHLHRHISTLYSTEVTVFATTEIAIAIQEMNLPPSKIDIGTLAVHFNKQASQDDSISYFVRKQLASVVHHQGFKAKDVVLYGFGRIGRLLAKELINTTADGNQLRLRAVVVREEVDLFSLQKRANLLKRDSIHGDFEGTIETDWENSALIINGMTIYFISSSAPEDVDYTIYGIENALLIDNTGAFRKKIDLERHLRAKGITQVLLTAPGKDLPDIVYGINEHTVSPTDIKICSAASCTTNAITPVLSIIDNAFGIVTGHVETIHAYTNDQNLVDNMHKKERRGRAAGLNMVITETGAGVAVSRVLPSLSGKLTSNAVRVPIPNGSLAIVQLELQQKCTRQELDNILLNAALKGSLVEQIKYENNRDLVSSDIIGTTAAAVIDAPATIVSSNGRNVVIYVWYDNEYGYVHQVMRLARYVAGVRQYSYY